MTSFALTDPISFGFYIRQQQAPVAATHFAKLPVNEPITEVADALHDTQSSTYQQPPRQLGLKLIAAAIVVGLHLYLPNLFSQAPLPTVAAQVPPMTVQLQRLAPPPVQKLTPAVKTPPKVEKPKPVTKKTVQPLVHQKTAPAPVEVAKAQPVVEPIQQPVAQPVSKIAPVETPVFVPATAEPDYLQNPPPAYPEVAYENGWEGTVLLNVHVKGDGKPDEVEVITSSGRKVLDNAAIATVASWSFVPAKQGDNTVESWVEVPIEFSLTNS